MGVFISYSSRDRALVEPLLKALRRARHAVWIDEELTGGEAWWRTILEQIRACDVFIVALSKNMLESKACQAELRYAQDLGKPILPVQIGPLDNMRINPLAHMQVIDYRDPSIDTGIELVSSVHTRRTTANPLPDPLPEEPPIPFAYLMRLASTISSPTLTAQQQTTLVAELKAGLEEDGDDISARNDITQLLCMLRDRPDVTWRTRTDVEAILTSLQQPHHNPTPEPPQLPPPTQPPQQTPQQYWQPPAGPTPFTPPTTPPKKSRTPWLIAGTATGALIAVALAALIIKYVTDDPTPPPPPAPSVAPEALNSLLLTPDEVDSIMGTTNLEPGEIFDQMSSEPPTISDPDCLGAQFNALQAAYQGSGYSTVADQALTSEDPEYTYVNQTAVLFPSPDQARAFVDASADSWGGCSGRTLTVTAKDQATYNWSFGDVTESDSQISQTTEQEGMEGYGCQHVLRAVANAVVEVQACQDNISDEADQIAESMAAKATA